VAVINSGTNAGRFQTLSPTGKWVIKTEALELEQAHSNDQRLVEFFESITSDTPTLFDPGRRGLVTSPLHLFCKLAKEFQLL
jgi:hypothetical protein